MSVAKRIRIVGSGSLVAGLLTAIVIYSTARPDEKLGILGVDVPTKSNLLQLERMGGRSCVLFNDLNEWFAGLWHGQRLAYTAGVLGFIGSLSCRWIANRPGYQPASDEHPDDGADQET